MKYDLHERISKIKWLFLDVDGVLTNGTLVYSSNGEEIKLFSVYDGHGIKMIRDMGIKVGIVSGRGSSALEFRLRELEIDYVVMNRNDKAMAFEEIAKKFGKSVYQSAHIGDDLPDLEIFKSVDVKVAVNNAVKLVREEADLCLSKNGGEGAVREFCDLYIECHKQG
jgi:3-deoxy-D-manno-octulosonate 8-phosphate phosphatase (KDO 8-P phosphatase)